MAPPKVDGEYHKQIESAREQLEKLISDTKHYAPLMLHLALHDAGIYGFLTGTESYLIKRGPNGSIRTPGELGHPSNKGLSKAVELCEEVKKKNEKITYADLYQLAGVAAVKKTGGPTIDFVPGREDSTQYPEEGRLLVNNELDESQLEKITKRMGLEEKDMVALFGGLCQLNLPVESEAAANDGKEGTSDLPRLDFNKEGTSDAKRTDFKFDNSYFIELEKEKNDAEKNNPLLKGAGFRKWVETYAKDENAFLKDYAAAHKKVSELGTSVAARSSGKGDTKSDSSSSSSASGTRNRVRLVQGIGIAVVTTAIILGFFLSRRSK